MKVKIGSFFAACALALVGCGDAGSDTPTLNDSGLVAAASSETAATTKSFKIGDKVDFDAFEVTITAVTSPASIGVLEQRPSEGGKFVAINYTLANTGDEALSSLDQPTLLLMDGEGKTFEQDSQATAQYVLQKTMIDKEFSASAGNNLNPGLRARTGAVWEIAEDRFDRNEWKVVLRGHENAVISLAKPSDDKMSSAKQ